MSGSVVLLQARSNEQLSLYERTFALRAKIGFFAAILLVLLPMKYSKGATVGFKPVQSYAVGTAPKMAVVADFNNDGKPDIAVVCVGDPSVGDDGGVSILLGNGDGTFQPAANVVTGKNPSSIAADDFNGDGRLDIVTIQSDNTVSALLGNGDGTFQAHVNYGTGSGPDFVAADDFNSDGRPDLVVTNSSGSSVGVLLGNGDGTFQSHVDYPTGGAANGVGVADLNGDGKLDLAVAAGNALVVFAGKGDGTFTQIWSSAALGIRSIRVTIGDFTSDGKPDVVLGVLAFGNATDSDLVLLTGDGDGTFSQGGAPITGACQNGTPVATDFDGDGKLDLGLFGSDGCFPTPTQKSNRCLLVLAGNGDGTFQAPVSFTPANVIGLGAAADLDGNKSPDLIATNTDNTVTVLLNTAGTDFSISASAPTASSLSPGQSATSTLSLSLLNSFDNPVSLACSVQPAQAGSPSCSLSSNSVTFDSNGKASATLTITAGSGAATLMVPHPHQGNSNPFSFGWLPVAAFGFMGTGLGCGFSRRRRSLFFVGCVLAGLIFEAACGGGSTGLKSVNYAITITGTSGSTQHSTTTTLTVQ